MGEHLVGRADACDVFDHALEEIDRGRSAAVALLGEPGIGKTRLLGELSTRADGRGYLVLYGSATELERDLPFWLFVDALDEYVQGLRPDRLEALDEDVRTELARVLPSLSRFATGEAAFQHERYRSHRAVRELLERLTGPRPLVLALDDLHWADPGSVELLSALLRRPPDAAVLLAMAVRPRQASDRVASALERSRHAGTLLSVDVDVLTQDEADELLGEAVDQATASALYEESGGNPFYLEQLVRSLAHERKGDGPDPSPQDLDVPPAVGFALAEEFALLSAGARRALEGAAVVGDPFEPELAAKLG